MSESQDGKTTAESQDGASTNFIVQSIRRDGKVSQGLVRYIREWEREEERERERERERKRERWMWETILFVGNPQQNRATYV